MKILNTTSHDLEPLVRMVVKRAGLKHTRGMVVSLSNKQLSKFRLLHRCSGHASPHYGVSYAKNVRQAFRSDKPVWLTGYISIGVVPPHHWNNFKDGHTIYGDVLGWITDFTEVLIHEVGHIWDAQRHGTKRWVSKRKWRWIDRPQEFVACKYAREKMATLPADIQEEMLRVAIGAEAKVDAMRKKLAQRIVNVLAVASMR